MTVIILNNNEFNGYRITHFHLHISSILLYLPNVCPRATCLVQSVTLTVLRALTHSSSLFLWARPLETGDLRAHMLPAHFQASLQRHRPRLVIVRLTKPDPTAKLGLVIALSALQARPFGRRPLVQDMILLLVSQVRESGSSMTG